MTRECLHTREAALWLYSGPHPFWFQCPSLQTVWCVSKKLLLITPILVLLLFFLNFWQPPWKSALYRKLDHRISVTQINPPIYVFKKRFLLISGWLKAGCNCIQVCILSNQLWLIIPTAFSWDYLSLAQEEPHSPNATHVFPLQGPDSPHLLTPTSPDSLILSYSRPCTFLRCRDMSSVPFIIIIIKSPTACTTWTEKL